MLHCPAQRVVAEQGNGGEHYGIGAVSQRIGKQSPDLALQNGNPVKAEQMIQSIGLINIAHQQHDRCAGGDIEHQIWYTLVPVGIAEAVKTPSQIFQWIHLLEYSCDHFTSLPGKSPEVNYEQFLKVQKSLQKLLTFRRFIVK